MILSRTYGGGHGHGHGAPAKQGKAKKGPTDTSVTGIVKDIYAEHGLGGFFIGVQVRPIYAPINPYLGTYLGPYLSFFIGVQVLCHHPFASPVHRALFPRCSPY